MAYPDDEQVQKTAKRCLQLFDQDPDCPGARHIQAQRFLSPQWAGLDGDAKDVALRPIVEGLASGALFLEDLLTDSSDAAANFLHWVSSFRLVSCLNEGKFESSPTTLAFGFWNPST